MSWNALGRGYSAILAQHYQHRIHHLQPNGKTLSTKGPKISARIRKNISVRMHDSRAIGKMLGHKTMAMTGWHVEKATAPLRAGERHAVAKLHRNMPALAGGRIAALSGQTLPVVLPTRA